MYQTINIAIKTDKDTEVRDGFDVTLDVIILGVSKCKFFPWITLSLFNTQ
jgi:hypothetical protein